MNKTVAKNSYIKMSMTINKILGLTICIAIFLSCTNTTDNDRDYLFAQQFAKMVSTNKTDSIHILYPSSEVCDSFVLHYNTDSITINATDIENLIEIDYGKGVKVMVLKNLDSTYIVQRSRGIFAFPLNEMKFAQQTGIYEKEIDDVEIAKRMTNINNMRSWLIQKHIKEFANKLKITGEPKVLETHQGMFNNDSYSILGYTVQNNTDTNIDGADYKLYIPEEGGMNMGTINTEQGRDIPPHGTVTIEYHSSFWSSPGRAYINTTLSQKEHFNKYYKFTGTEYKEYLQTQK